MKSMQILHRGSACLFLLLLLLSGRLYAQAGRTDVRGIVRDENGRLLPGVSVTAKNTGTGFTAGTQTDTTGVFRFSGLAAGSYSFTASFLGYQAQTLTGYNLKPGGEVSLIVRLQPESRSLSEVVVIGYGTQRREELTGAVGSVKSKDFVPGIATDAAQLIRGKVSGLNIVNPDGNPTGVSQVMLRGVTTLTASTSPLILIDGIPGSLTTVAPEDIDRIDVLKDGSAAAIYGTRGTNGVILITTKKVNGELPPTIDVNAYATTQRLTRRLDFMSADQYRTLVAQGKPGAQDYGASTNWLDQITQTPISQVYQVSLRAAIKPLTTSPAWNTVISMV